jgi:hypothetical protein
MPLREPARSIAKILDTIAEDEQHLDERNQRQKQRPVGKCDVHTSGILPRDEVRGRINPASADAR